MSRLRVLALARTELASDRGTPIRIKSILSQLAVAKDIELVVASWDLEAPIKGVSWTRLERRPFDSLRQTIRIVRKGKYDLVIGHTLSTWFLLIATRLFTRAKTMLEFHGFPEEEARLYGGISAIRFWFDRICYEITFKICHLITACSETSAEHIRRFNSNTIAVYGGADIRRFNPSVIPEKLKRDKELLVGYAGNGRVWQGLPFLFDIFQSSPLRESSLELFVLLSEKRNLDVPLGIRVHHAVSHNEVPRFLAACDALVIPRPQNPVNRLSFPSKLIEYMAMGKPVIASRTSDAHRIITDRVDGILFDPGDRSGLIEALMELRDPALREHLGTAAAETVRMHYTWEKQTNIITTSIRKLFPLDMEAR